MNLQAGWFTSNNTTNNDTTMKEFGKIVNPNCHGQFCVTTRL